MWAEDITSMCLMEEHHGTFWVPATGWRKLLHLAQAEGTWHCERRQLGQCQGESESDLVPAASCLWLCACEGLSVAAGL